MLRVKNIKYKLLRNKYKCEQLKTIYEPSNNLEQVTIYTNKYEQLRNITKPL